MADAIALDIDDEDFHEEGEDDLRKLKSSVTKRKGRGFKDSSTRRENDKYESIHDEDMNEVGPARSVEGWILFVTNVHEEAQEDDVRDAFGEYGQIKNVHLNLDRRTGFLKGYALVEYETFKEAQNALDGLHDTEILGQKVGVDWAFVRGAQNGRRHGRKK
eukprot:gene4585-5187_t